MRKAGALAAATIRFAVTGGAFVGAAGILLITVATVADVVKRIVTGQSMAGVLETGEVVLVILVFLGLAAAQRERMHVASTILTSRVPPRFASLLRVVGLLAWTGLLVWMAVVCTGRAIESVAGGEYRFGLIQIPVWPARVAIALGVVLLLVAVLMTLVNEVRSVAGRASEPEESAP